MVPVPPTPSDTTHTDTPPQVLMAWGLSLDAVHELVVEADKQSDRPTQVHGAAALAVVAAAAAAPEEEATGAAAADEVRREEEEEAARQSEEGDTKATKKKKKKKKSDESEGSGGGRNLTVGRWKAPRVPLTAEQRRRAGLVLDEHPGVGQRKSFHARLDDLHTRAGRAADMHAAALEARRSMYAEHRRVKQRLRTAELQVRGPSGVLAPLASWPLWPSRGAFFAGAAPCYVFFFLNRTQAWLPAALPHDASFVFPPRLGLVPPASPGGDGGGGGAGAVLQGV